VIDGINSKVDTFYSFDKKRHHSEGLIIGYEKCKWIMSIRKEKEI